MPDLIPKATVDAILKALANAQYRWRTVPGVAKETDLTEDVVKRAIAQAAEHVVRAAATSEEGQELYTTRDRYRQTASVSERLLGALKNRAG